MGRLIEWNLISLDGYFEGGAKWDLEWHSQVWDKELEKFSLDQLQSAGMLLFGRTTYEGLATYWRNATGEVANLMNSLPKAVVSRTLKEADWNNTRVLRGGTSDEVTKLKSETDKDILVFGSGALSATLTKAGLFDELRIALAPTILGRGATLFGRDLPRQQLKLLEARTLSSGLVILRYSQVSPINGDHRNP
ncbi:MAG TPA: dihydrofolate reductase family protein [Terracidiphilus sp.]|jgi:dihydrofolate reductase|nr:dihydrofolate reductase family protein [Terracidiphilus sp.]